jgi:hypothetical protein
LDATPGFECGLPLSSAVRLALPIKGRSFTEATPPQFVGLKPAASKIRLFNSPINYLREQKFLAMVAMKTATEEQRAECNDSENSYHVILC